MAIYFEQFYQQSADACVVDLTPPTFSGITGLTVNGDGSLNASWSAGSDVSTPLRYEVYVQADTSTGLFGTGNIQQIVSGTSARIFTTPDLNYLQNGTTYHVGVRAVDAVGNRNTNTVSLSASSNGVLSGQVKYEGVAVLSIDPANNLEGRFYLLGDGKAVKTLLGTADFSIYDESEIIIASFTQTGISANANGVYTLSPVTAVSIDPFTNYRCRIAITHNSIVHESYVGFIVGE